jgi:hypothetical protein
MAVLLRKLTRTAPALAVPAPLMILTFGGCTLNNPLGVLSRQKLVTPIYKKMGFRATPYALSSSAAVQLLDFVTGEREIPVFVRKLCYGDPFHEPTPEQSALVHQADLILVEMSTPIEFKFQNFILNSNRFEEVIVDSLRSLEGTKKLASKWRSALMNQLEDQRAEIAAELLSQLPSETEHDRWVRTFVGEARSDRINVDRMVEDLDQIRQRVRLPLALLMHNFRYMPDGRPIAWPGEFRNETFAVAERLGVPCLDLAPFVAAYGVPQVMADDMRHWRPGFMPHTASHLHDLIRGVLNPAFRPARALGAPLDLAPVQGAETEEAGFEEPIIAGADNGFISDDPTAEVVSAPLVGAEAGPLDADYDHRSGTHFPLEADTDGLILVLGEASALGINRDTTGDASVTVSPEHPGHALMFDVGTAPNGRPVSIIRDLRERSSSTTKETPCGGLADQIMRGCEERFGRKPRIIFASVGRSGASLLGNGTQRDDGLLRGSDQHKEALRLVKAAHRVSVGAGRRLRVLALCLAHGETDARARLPQASYQRGLVLLRQAYDTDIRSVTGQADPIPLLTYQTNRGAARPGAPAAIALAQLAVSAVDPLIRCIGPIYDTDPEISEERRPAFLRAASYRRIGQQFGRYILDDLWGRGREPLRVSDCVAVRSNLIHVKFNRPIALETDDTVVTLSSLGPGLGIDLHDSGFRGQISGIEPIAGSATGIAITLSGPLTPGRARLLIANRATGEPGFGRVAGPRSGIRSAEPYDFDPRDGTPLFEWACTEIVPVL